MKGAQKIQSQSCAAENRSSDNLNRMTSYRSSGSHNDNGLRVKKTVPGITIKSTFYRYDGQMSIEEWELNEMTGESLSDAQNPSPSRGRGAGVRVIQRATATINETSYPLYDAHGNMTAQLLKNGASFTVANEKSYEACRRSRWNREGGIRAGNSNPEYKGRYCANLGHTQDDESGLIYMRARYYEPSSGRFVSEVRACYGRNWFSYCSSNPINKIDQSGKYDDFTANIAYGLFFVALFFYIDTAVAACALSNTAKMTTLAHVGFMLMYMGLDLPSGGTLGEQFKRANEIAFIGAVFGAVVFALTVSLNPKPTVVGVEIVGVIYEYAAFICLMMAADALDAALT